MCSQLKHEGEKGEKQWKIQLLNIYKNGGLRL